jgi:hypothetical protein
VSTVLFEVEQAGCPSCAARVRTALDPLGEVSDVAIDEEADEATVRLAPASTVDEDAVNRALVEASAGSGHGYCVKPGSWQLVT